MRDSNIELLRIVALFIILFWHGIHHGFLQLELDAGSHTFLNIVQYSLLWHVNVFLIISGYFGIQFKMKKFVRFILYVMMYFALLSISDSLVHRTAFHTRDIILMPYALFKNGLGWWFVKPYLIMYLLSPILNLTRQLPRKEFMTAFGTLTFLNIICGFFFKSGFNNDGFCPEHFCYMYIIGIGLRNSFPSIRKSYLWGTMIICLLALCLIGVMEGWHRYCYAYNNPFVIICAISLFLLFLKLDIKSKNINYFAKSVFATYLITDQSEYTRHYFSKMAEIINEYIPDIRLDLAVWLIIAFVIFAVCVAIDKIVVRALNSLLPHAYR